MVVLPKILSAQVVMDNFLCSALNVKKIALLQYMDIN